MALWKLETLRRWWEQKTGDDTETNPEPQGEGDDEPEGGDDEGDGTEDGDDAGDDDGDGGDEGGEGEGEGDGPDDGEGDSPGGGEGGDDEGDDSEGGNDGDEGGDGENGGGAGQGHGNGRIEKEDFADLEKIPESEIRDPNVGISGEGDLPTEQNPSVIVLDSIVKDADAPEQAEGDASNKVWRTKLKGMKAIALRITLRRLMQRSDWSAREGGLRSGRLTGRGLNRLLTGSQNVFERRHQKDGESVAVSLLIDSSGSMWGTKMHAAADTALLLAETAASAGAKVEVLTFTSHTARLIGSMQEAMGEEEETHTYIADASSVVVVKSFTSHIGKLRRMYTYLRDCAGGGTHDASALKAAGARLLKHSANRRILFVIADGEGDNVIAYRHVVASLEAKGVIVIGIGIECGVSFQERFTFAATMQDVSGLLDKTFGMLIGAIAKARHL